MTGRDVSCSLGLPPLPQNQKAFVWCGLTYFFISLLSAGPIASFIRSNLPSLTDETCPSSSAVSPCHPVSSRLLILFLLFPRLYLSLSSLGVPSTRVYTYDIYMSTYTYICIHTSFSFCLRKQEELSADPDLSGRAANEAPSLTARKVTSTSCIL